MRMTLNRREWTALDRDRLRAWRAAGVPVRECARRLGRTLWQTAAALRRFGLRTPHLWRRIDPAELRRRALAGESDGRIAAAFGVHRHTVLRLRRRLGLTGAQYRSLQGRRVTAGQRRRLVREGLDSFAEVAQDRRLAECARRGWPAAWTPREADVLDAVARGPLTAADLARAWGLSAEHRCWPCRLLRALAERGVLTRRRLARGAWRYSLAVGIPEAVA